jgi:hypothetical protein
VFSGIKPPATGPKAGSGGGKGDISELIALEVSGIASPQRPQPRNLLTFPTVEIYDGRLA